jgi:hypothetical protein
MGRDFLANAAELAGLVEELDPVSDVVEWQGFLSARKVLFTINFCANES